MARQSRTTAAKEVITSPEEQNTSTDRKSGRLIEPGLLLLLKENPSHGYELLNKFNNLKINEGIIDPGTIYRILRDMEKKGLVNSKWETERPGPARRKYEITSAAYDQVEIWAREIEKDIVLLEGLLKKINEFVPTKKHRKTTNSKI